MQGERVLYTLRNYQSEAIVGCSNDDGRTVPTAHPFVVRLTLCLSRPIGAKQSEMDSGYRCGRYDEATGLRFYGETNWHDHSVMRIPRRVRRQIANRVGRRDAAGVEICL